MPASESLIPYGFFSYEEYYGLIVAHSNESALVNMLIDYKLEVMCMNIKENWSVLRYLGCGKLEGLPFTTGRYYYWPCSAESPEYEGIIDDEEFTSYLHEVTPAHLEIVEDHTHMAALFLRHTR